MINYILTGSLLLAALSAYPQMRSPTRYKDDVFPDISIGKNLSYSSNPRTSIHRFDWYEPIGDTGVSSRPLIIWMHGGGFKFGSKNMQSVKLWCSFFARRGYVCAAIDYKLGKKDFRFDFDDLVRNCYAAVRDTRLAIAWFKKNAARLRIDTSRIILAGNSAGGMMALQTAYASDAELLKLIGNPDSTKASHMVEPGDVAAVVNFWGGIFQPGWLHNARVPIVSVHGRLDNIVPYEQRGFPLYGSGSIHRIADSLHIPNRLKTYDDYSHELQKRFNPVIASKMTQKRWIEAAQFAADFLYDELFAVKR
ncbi:MAG TPA: alpha/beta hydrolase [Puia sp.]|jgi:predicted esterase|nr:alpha/beta hydrolase [Puia sp.]